MIESIVNNISNFFTFLFSTFEGIAILIAAFLILTFVIAIILERRTKNNIFNNQETNEEE